MFWLPKQKAFVQFTDATSISTIYPTQIPGAIGVIKTNEGYAYLTSDGKTSFGTDWYPHSGWTPFMLEYLAGKKNAATAVPEKTDGDK